MTEFQNLEIADTHEHFYDERDRVAMHVDFFTLVEQSYVMSDLISAGMPPESSRMIRNQQASDADRWRAFEPYWNNTRFTGYGQALRLAIADLYGVREISASTLHQINKAIHAQNKPGLYHRIVRERARIRFCVEDDSCGGCTTMRSTKENFELFVLARRFDKFIAPATPTDVKALETTTNISITSFADYKKAALKNFQQNLDQGMRAIKVALAYYRELFFQEVSEADAERDFESLMRQEKPLPESFRKSFVRPFRRLEDHMFHYFMQLADSHRLPVQIHTGMFAGNSGLITNSNPTHLVNTFQLYPRINFDIFHISFPYQEELGVLAKSFPNVYADFCWAYVISPLIARRTLHEFLEIAPVTKILGFGGDYKHPELAYAHAMMARRAVTQVLSAKVSDGFCTEQEAFRVGKTLLYDNAARLFSWKDAKSN